MKRNYLFIAANLCMAIAPTLSAYAQESVQSYLQLKQLLLRRSEQQYQDRENAFENLVNAYANAKAGVKSNTDMFRYELDRSKNQTNEQITKMRVEGTVQDVSLLAGSGDLGTGSILAGVNMLTRKAKISDTKKENSRIIQELEAERSRADHYAREQLQSQFEAQVNLIVNPVIRGMDILFQNKPSAPVFPADDSPDSRQSVFVYFCSPMADRLLISELWRIDRYPDGSWWPAETGLTPFLDKVSYIQTICEYLPLCKEIEARRSQLLPGHFVAGSFSSREAAIKHQIALINKSIEVNVPVFEVACMPQTTIEEFRIFLANIDSFWGLRNKATPGSAPLLSPKHR